MIGAAESARSRALAGILLALFAALSVNLCWKMLVADKKITSRPYVDERFVATMNDLIAKGVFAKRKNGIALDQDRLLQEVSSPALRRRVERSAAWVFEERGRLVFEEGSARVVDRHAALDPAALNRGRILDRAGQVLAWTESDKAAGRAVRRYASGEALLGLVGYAGPVYGERNLEASLNGPLAGTTDKSLGRWAFDLLRPGEPGDDVMLTVDASLQERAYRELNGQRGAVVVLDVHSGAVLALVSSPAFDPNTPPGRAWVIAMRDRERQPFINRALAGVYPPGSTFKIIDAAALLETGAAGQEPSVTCTGRHPALRIRDLESHGHVVLAEAFTHSCNVFFAEEGVALGPRLADFAARFGFGAPVNLLPVQEKVPLAAVGSLAFAWRTPDGIRSYAPDDYRRNPKIVAQGAIGQNLVTATPLQMAMVAQTIANGGKLVQPWVVREVRPGGLEGAGGVDRLGGRVLTRRFNPPEGREVVSKPTARAVAGLMRRVVEDGTGRGLERIVRAGRGFTTAARSGAREFVPFAGKTGTAEVGDRDGNRRLDADEQPHAWFVGFAPAEKPRVAVAVLVENGGSGGKVAGPVAVRVLAQALEVVGAN